MFFYSCWCLPLGPSHNIWDPKVLPFSAAVSTQSSHHPSKPSWTFLLSSLKAEFDGSVDWVQFLACLVQLPPPMNTTDILWVSCFSCPLLRYPPDSSQADTSGFLCKSLLLVSNGCCYCSVSLLGKPPDSSVMTVATGKNLDSIPKKVSQLTAIFPLRPQKHTGAFQRGIKGSASPASASVSALRKKLL